MNEVESKSTLREMLVHVDGSESGRARVHLAMELAQQMGARLVGLHVLPPTDVPHIFRAGDVASELVLLGRRLVADAKKSAQIFRDEAKEGQIERIWLEASGDVAEEICRRARYADLVIMGQYEAQTPIERHPLPLANSVVHKCGRPVLVVPAGQASLKFGNVVLAWDGSREAVRAVHDALPLLLRSGSVQILRIARSTAPEERTDTEDLASHLAKHGVHVETNVLEKSAAEHALLRDQIDQGKYDLVVMGAYSHPPWFEFVFGGATASILSSSAMPVLVSH